MTIEQFYETIDGNYQSALSTMMNDAFIKKMLAKFLASNTFASLKENFINKDYNGIFESAHSLKGVAGNLAFTNLFNKTLPIVEATRHYQEGQIIDIDQDFIVLEEEYKKVVENLKLLLA